MVTMGMNKLSATACHAHNEAPEGCLRNFLQFSNEGLFRLLDGLRKVLHCLMSLPRMSQTSSIGFKCADLVGHSIYAIPVSCWYE